MRYLPCLPLFRGLLAALVLSFSLLNAADLVWNTPQGGTWAVGEPGWYVQGDPAQSDTAFTDGDNVFFGEPAVGGTVSLTLDGTVTAGNATVASGAVYLWEAGEASRLTASNLTLEEGATLTLGSAASPLDAAFTTIALGEGSSLTWFTPAAPQGTFSGSGAFELRMTPTAAASLAGTTFVNLAAQTQLKGTITIGDVTVTGNLRIVNGTTAASVSADSLNVRLQNVVVNDYLNLGSGSYSTANGFTLTVGEGCSINRFQTGVRNSTIVGDITLNVEGGTIGQGNTGFEYARFGFTGQDGSLTGNVYLNVSGGTIAAPYVVFGGFGNQNGRSMTGDVFIHLTGGTIESTVLGAGSWGGFVDGNVTALLEGGTLGLDGQTRQFAPGQAVGASQASRPVTGNVSITLTGGTDGYGTTFVGNYSILAGGNSASIAIGGNSLVTLQNITQKNADGVSGVANFTGLISGGNNSNGTGVVGTRTLQFIGYTTDAAAQFRFFDTALVTGSSAVRLTNAANSDIAAWQITGNSSLAFASVAALGGGTAAVDTGSSLIYDPEGEADDTLATNVTGPGSLIKKGGNTLALTGDIQIGSTTVEDGVLSIQTSEIPQLGAVRIDENAALDLRTAETRALSLDGNGALESPAGNRLFIVGMGGLFEGSLDGFAGTVSVAGGASQTIAASGGNDTSLEALAGGSLTLRHAGAAAYAGLTLEPNGTLSVVQAGNTASSLTLGSASIGSNSNLNLTLAPGAADTSAIIVTDGAPTLGSGVNLTLTAEPGTAGGKTISLTLIENTGLDTWDKNWTLNMAGDLANYAASLSIVNGNLVLTGFTTHLPSYAETPVAETGSQLLDEARGKVPVDSPLGQLIQQIQNQIAAGSPGSSVSRLMASAAGSSATGLGLAQRGMLRNTMTELRNRMLGMGVDPCVVNDDLPRLHMWIQALGGTERTDRQQDYSGYTLDSIGGMLGADVDINRCYTAGMAIHAAYGRYRSHTAEIASGDLDDYGASLFVRFYKRQWTHLLLVTGSGYHATLKRSVGYPGGGYGTKGTPDGYGVGALYEVNYDITLGEEGATLLQPLFQAAITHTALRAYSETQGGNASLHYGSQEMTTGTFALGARLTTPIGENVFNRPGTLSLRANVAQDVGDEYSSARVGFIGRTATGTVRSAEAGSTALQIGVGLGVPVCAEGTLFFDAHADFRSRQNSVHGGIGYAWSF